MSCCRFVTLETPGRWKALLYMKGFAVKCSSSCDISTEFPESISGEMDAGFDRVCILVYEH
uniref:Uncharacterized protein n=1 Tax=Setaria digitata TaxID=48799 RepID=A0A915Q1Y0_9BILA